MKMGKKNKRKRILGFIVSFLILTAICWDLYTVEEATAVEGTFRYVSDFDPISTTVTKVAIVPSDYTSLDSPRNRTQDLTDEQVVDMVRTAIELQGGLDGIITKGDTVMMKVNLVGGYSASGEGENTDVRVPRALMIVIDEAMEGDVVFKIAEGTARINDDPNEIGSVWDNSGYRDLLTDGDLNGIDFQLVSLNQTYSDLQDVALGEKGTAAPHNYNYKIHKEELAADVYISVPVLKVHDPGITCALKNQIGTAPAAYYGYNKMAGTAYYGGLVHVVGQYDWTEEEIVDLSNIAGIDFVVVDALMCLESGKTYTGDNQVRMNTIVAGADPVAVDHVCAKLFCLNPSDIAHITLAERVGLGTNQDHLIKIRGAEINDVRKKVIKTGSIQGVFGQSNKTWILSKTFSGTDIATEYVANEANIEPVGGENDWTEPVYFFDNMLDLLGFYEEATDIVTYAFTYFYSPADKEAELLVGSHEDMIVYLNGENVYSFTGVRGYNVVAADEEEINIKKGENRLLVKTLNTLGDYSFSLNICDYESLKQYAGNRVEGLVFYTEKGGYTGISDNKSLPELTLRNYPNPVTNLTQIEFELPGTSKTSVSIYDINGKLVAVLANENLSAGLHTLEWNATSQNGNRVNSGIYFCTVKSKNYYNSIKILVK